MRVLICLLAIGTSGCAYLPTKASLQEYHLWPSRTEPFCLPDARYKAEKRRAQIGLRCRW